MRPRALQHVCARRRRKVWGRESGSKARTNITGKDANIFDSIQTNVFLAELEIMGFALYPGQAQVGAPRFKRQKCATDTAPKFQRPADLFITRADFCNETRTCCG